MIRLNIAAALLVTALFLTIGCSDECVCPEQSDPPRIIAHYPANGDTLVEPDTFVTVTFDVEMDTATVSAGSFTLERPGGPVSASVSFDGTTATLTPFKNLYGNTIYTARVSSGVTNKAGAPMGVDYAWSFTTDYSNLLLLPEIEYTLRDSNDSDQADSIYGNGPPGLHLLFGQIQPDIEDRAILEFSLEDIIGDEVLAAVLFVTVYDVNDEYFTFTMEAWGFEGNGTAELTDWSNGHLITSREMTSMGNGSTFAFSMLETINSAAAAGATHVGFRLTASDYTHARIYTSDAAENQVPRLLIQQ
jgi:hypothetical protein